MDKGNKIHTLEDALLSKVRFSIPEDTVRTILIERALDGNMAYVDANPADVRLAYADILKWIVLGPSKMNNTSDSDTDGAIRKAVLKYPSVTVRNSRRKPTQSTRSLSRVR